MTRSKNIIIAGVLTWLVILSLVVLFPPEKGFLTIEGQKYSIEVADSHSERTKGLAYRESLNNSTGMLFVYTEESRPAFWMNGMQFNIDMIWINANHKIVDISKNVSPETFPETFKPSEPVQYDFEINGGLSDKQDIAIGDFDQFSLYQKYH